MVQVAGKNMPLTRTMCQGRPRRRAPAAVSMARVSNATISRRLTAIAAVLTRSLCLDRMAAATPCLLSSKPRINPVKRASSAAALDPGGDSWALDLAISRAPEQSQEQVRKLAVEYQRT